MLMKGAKINAKASYGATPLMLAVQYGNTESARVCWPNTMLTSLANLR